jgi:hypothetical protein
LKLDYPEGGRDADTQGNDCRRSEDADEQTPAPAWVESDRRPNRTSLTGRNGEGDGECDRDHKIAASISAKLAFWSIQMFPGALVADSKETWVCSYLSQTLLLGVGAYAVVGWWWAEPMGALAMLSIILWQGWKTLSEAREPADHED